jgi:hypothetical protein
MVKKMNKTKLTILVVAISIFLIPLVKEIVVALEIDSIRVLRILPQEETAMIQAPDGKRQLIKVGDSVGRNGKVIEIIEGRIVLEERTKMGLETVIIRLEDGKQRIERIRRVGDQQPTPLRLQ